MSLGLGISVMLGVLTGSAGTAQARRKKPVGEAAPAAESTAPKGPVAPEPDSQGRVNFGNPTLAGLGRVTVKSSTGQKIQVYLDGRYFGDAPITIYSVPKGDYIVEGTVIADGKQLSRPVSVTENEEAMVDLNAGKVETPVAAEPAFGHGEISPGRLRAAKILVVVSAASLVLGITFGVLEMGAENDYEKAPGSSSQADLDSIENRGKRDEKGIHDLLDLGVIAGYPLFRKGNTETPQTTAFMMTPLLQTGAAGMTGGALTLRF